MTGLDDVQSRKNGQQAAARMTLDRVLALLTDAQVETLLEEVTANLASLRGLWMDRKPRSGFREELLRELEITQFMLRERLKLGPRQAAIHPQIKLVCIRCDATIAPDGESDDDIVCPFCRQSDWVFGTRREEESDATDA